MILLKDLCKKYGDSKIIDNINLQIKSGSFAVINGPSGSGKSTLLGLISGMIRPSSGDVIIKGEIISKYSDILTSDFRNRYIGFIFQKFNLIKDFTVYENIAVPLLVGDYSFNEIRKMVFETAEYFELRDKIFKKVKHLSGGEEQRVALARALVNNPEIIIADEPTANLDYRLKKEVLGILEDINKKGKTIVVATHDSIFKSAEDVNIINITDGRV